MVSTDVHGRDDGRTASIGFCESVLANRGVDLTMSTSSSTLGCRVATRCDTCFSSDGADCPGIDMAGLFIDTVLELDMVDVDFVDGGLEIDISSSVTFGCEKRVDAEDE